MESKKEEEESSSFEYLITLAGTNGWRNYLIFLACSFSGLVTALPIFSYQFLGATPDHWCHIEELTSNNWTSDQIKNLSIPYTIIKGEIKYDGCTMNDLDYSALASQRFEEVVEAVSLSEDYANNNTIQCSSRDFDPDYDTIVTEWDLVCDRRFLYSSTQAAVQLGMLVGSMICGYIIDRFGRLKVYRIMVIINIVVGFILAVSPVIYFFLFFRVLSALSGMGFYMSSFVLITELCGTKQRSLVVNYYVIPWTFGILLVSGISYHVRQWQSLQACITIPSVLLLVTFLVLPESPRWLIIKGRYEEALKIFQNLAKANKRQLPSDQMMITYMKNIHEANTSTTTSEKKELNLAMRIEETIKHVFILLTEPSLRYQTLAIFFCWFSVAMVYYGVSLGSSIISTSDYFYIFLGGLIEIPAYLILWPATVLLGRRKTIIGLFIVCSLSILSVMIIDVSTMNQGHDTLKLVLFLAGKLAITAAFHLIWVFTAELYPTTLRSLVIGESSMVARAGSICSPFINDILGMTTTWAPAALFGSISLVAGITASVLPETSGKDLPDSLQKTDLKKKKESTNF